jgi:hypothetical protein
MNETDKHSKGDTHKKWRDLPWIGLIGLLVTVGDRLWHVQTNDNRCNT